MVVEGRWGAGAERRTIVAIADVLRDHLPPRWRLDVDLEPDGPGRPVKSRADAVLTLTAPSGEVVTYVTEVKRRITTPTIAMVLDRIRSNTPDDRPSALPLVLAPYLPARTRAALTDRRVSFADATGNTSIVSDRPGLWISSQGADRDPDTATTALRSLKGRGAGRAIRALVEFRPPFGVRELASRASVSAPTLSRVLDLLAREDLVERDARGPVLAVDWQGVLRRWSLDYSLRSSNHLVPCLDPRGLAHFTERLIDSELTYAATVAFASVRLNPFLPARDAVIYVPDAAAARSSLALRETDRGLGANVFLVEPFDEVVFDRTFDRDGLTCANPVQVVADMLTGPGREPSGAEELMRWMEMNPDVWRS